MASMASSSKPEPIFNVEDSNAINDYFVKLIREQSMNGWFAKFRTNYLQLKDIEYLHDFIGTKLLELDKPYNKNNQDSPYIKKLSKFYSLVDTIIQDYNVNILGMKKRNNITINNSNIIIKNNITELKNNNSKTELISIINSFIKILINEFILNPIYFNQKDLKNTLTNKPFAFIKDDDLKKEQDQIVKDTFLSKTKLLMESQGAQHVATQASLKALQNKQTAKKAQEQRINEVKKRMLTEKYKLMSPSQKSIMSLEEWLAKGGMRKSSTHKISNHKSNKHKSNKHKSNKHKLNKHKSNNHKTSTHKTKNHKTLKRKIKTNKKSKTKIHKGGEVNCDFLKYNSNTNSNTFKSLRVSESYNINKMLQRIFPFEECKNSDDVGCNNDYCINEGTIPGTKPGTNKFKCKPNTTTKTESGILGSFASNFATNFNPKLTENLYSYFQQQIKKLFDLPNDYKSNNVNKVSDHLLTWSDYLDITKENINKQNINKQNCKNYYKFRKIAVDALIVMIIIALCKKKGIINYEIKKLNTSIYKSSNYNEIGCITIIYQSVGSETSTSDYDLTLYSKPVSEITPEITAIFNHAFKYGLGKTAGEIFDTNLYSHIFYIYSKIALNGNTIETQQQSQSQSQSQSQPQPVFLKLEKDASEIYKYFINPGHVEFHENELLYANLILLEYIEGKYDFKVLLDKKTFVETYTGKSNDLFIPEENQEYSALRFPLLGQIEQANSINLSKSKSKKNKKCISDNTNISNEQCKKFDGEEIFTRLTTDKEPIKLLKTLETDINNATPKQLLPYINFMRLSLWFADETYHTFSAYFHVIHCVTIPGSNIDTINDLLTKNRKSFMNICKVSAIENFNFMFHYFQKTPAEFKKKTAKYLARLSHALAIIQMLKRQSQFVLSSSTLEEFTNFGNHNDITNKYKYGITNVKKTMYSGLDFNVLNSALITINTPLMILKSIYEMFVTTTKSQLQFDIQEKDLIIKLSF
jgi:hypothetical protein